LSTNHAHSHGEHQGNDERNNNGKTCGEDFIKSEDDNKNGGGLLVVVKHICVPTKKVRTGSSRPTLQLRVISLAPDKGTIDGGGCPKKRGRVGWSL
jgi:hypothetical protein